MGLFVKEFSTGGKSLTEVSWLDRFRPPVAGFDSPGDNDFVKSKSFGPTANRMSYPEPS
jgi:hypothetical protein